MLQQYGNRIQLLHLKDRTPGFPTTRVLDASSEHFTEVGAGTIHWAEILAAAEKNGVKHFFVERDSGDLPALESLRISFRNLQKIR
jgi:sugar phosphate isomerase/epimerase